MVRSATHRRETRSQRLSGAAVASLWLVAVFAYIDPGSGSFIFQAFIGGVLAVLVILRTSWSRIVGLFKRSPREQEQR